MKHKAFGTAAFLGLIAVAGCYPYASEAINNGNYNTVLAIPVFTYLKVGDSTQVILRLINNANNGTITSYTISEVGSGIAVHYQVGYRPLFTNDTLNPTGDKNAQSYYVVGLTPGRYSFKATPTQVNTGVSTVVNVLVAPATLGTGSVLSATTAVAGDTVTVTAPAGDVFSQTSTIKFTSGTPIIIARSADSTSITFIVGPGTSGPITVTKIGQITAPTLTPLTLTSKDSLTSPAAPTDLGPALSATTGNAGDVVTITAPTGLSFTPTSAVTFAGGPAPVITSRAADGSSISFIVGPGVTGVATVTGVVFTRGPTLPAMTLNSTNSLSVPALAVAPTTVSNAAPDIGQSFTVTLGGGLRFIKTSKVFIGGTEAGITNVSADSSTATVTPALASDGTSATGLITYTNIALSFLNSVALSLPGDKSVTVSDTYAGGTDANAGSIATASTITAPPSGRSIVITDAGPFANSTPGCGAASADGCRIYKLVVATATTFDMSLTVNGCGDTGVYLLTAAGASTTIADSKGQCPDPRTEPLGTTASLAAGTYYITIEYFDVNSGYPDSQPINYYTLRITAH